MVLAFASAAPSKGAGCPSSNSVVAAGRPPSKNSETSYTNCVIVAENNAFSFAPKSIVLLNA